MKFEEFKGKKILVTGATGLIGSNLVDLLMSTPVEEIYATGRNIDKLVMTFKDYNEDKRLKLLAHDASKLIPDCISDIDYIFHAAGPMERSIVLNQPVNVVLPNIIGTINLLEFLKEQKKLTNKDGRIIIFSSVTVYNNSTGVDLMVAELDTSNAIALDSPTACYAESKRMSEVIADSYFKQYGIDVVKIRLSTVYGYAVNVPDTAFYEFIKKAVNGENIRLNSAGLPRRDNIYIDDAIEGLLTVAIKGKSGEVYNISSAGQLDNFASIDELAVEISKQTQCVLNALKVVVEVPICSARKPGLLLDNSKLKSLGWTLKTSLAEGIKQTISMYINKQAQS